MTAETVSSNFYFPPSRLNFVNELQGLIQQNRLIAIEGPVGVGKTVLLEELLTTAMPDANKCYITASKSINDIQIRSRVIEQLFGNVLFDPEKPLVASFVEFNQQTQLMLAIDNAHYLSGQIIGELLQAFSEMNKSGIQFAVLLSFDKSLSTTLLNINSSLLVIKAVPLLSKQESYQLLAEYVPDLPAESHTRVKRWIDNAGGIPIQLLAYDQDTDLTLTDASTLDIKLWGGVVVLASVVLALGLYWYRLGLNDNAALDVATEPKTVKEQVVTNWSEPELTAEHVASVSASIATLATASPADIMAVLSTPLPSEGQLKSTGTTTPYQDAGPVNNESEPLTEPNPISNDSKAPLSTAEAALATSPETQDGNTAKTEQTERLQTDSSEQLDEQTSAAIAQRQNPSLDLDDTTQALSLPLDDEIVASSSEQDLSIQRGYFYKIDNMAFLSLPADHYVLQLTAVSSESTLAKYLASSPVNLDSVRIYKIKRNHADWIVVTYGLFSSIEAARAEAERVEPNAWAKSVRVIQQQITLFNQSQS